MYLTTEKDSFAMRIIFNPLLTLVSICIIWTVLVFALETSDQARCDQYQTEVVKKACQDWQSAGIKSVIGLWACVLVCYIFGKNLVKNSDKTKLKEGRA